MKITAQEEFGLRLMIRLANSEEGHTIAEMAEMESMSHANTAKLCRCLRMGGFIESSKGHTGGYQLASPADEINIGILLKHLGGSLYCEGYCGRFQSGEESSCCNSMDCSVRGLWRLLQQELDKVMSRLFLSDFMGGEKNITPRLSIEEIALRAPHQSELPGA